MEELQFQKGIYASRYGGIQKMLTFEDEIWQVSFVAITLLFHHCLTLTTNVLSTITKL